MTITKCLKVSQHAKQRAFERFNVDKQKAAEWLQSVLKKARYIGEACDDNGDTGHIYAYRRICITLNEDKSKIVTVYERHSVFKPIMEQVEAVIDREIQRLKRKEESFIKRHRRRQLELEHERSRLRIEQLQTRSRAKELAIQARINAINIELADIKQKILDIKRERSAVVKSKAVIV